MAAIAIEHLGKTYADGTQAVTDLNLDIMDGEFLVLVGPSGCGKTTALRMIAGLEEISEGTILIGDREVNNVPARDRDVAMVFQSYALYPHLTVRENIGFGLTLRKVKKADIDRRVGEVAGILELSDHLDRKPRQLSGGQRQRVAMGRAIVREPQAFLMDEPLSNLDAKLRVQMRAQIARIQRDLGVTTTYVTHDQTEAMTLGDRVAVMRAGLLQQVGPPQTLYESPTNLFVAGFIGSPGMNLISAELSTDGGADGDGFTLAIGDASIDVPASVLHQRPALRGYAGKPVAVGIRPEDMEDAEIVGHEQGATLSSVADLVEAMGSDVMVHFPVQAEAVLTEEQRQIADETGAAVAGSSGTVLVGRFSPRTRVYEGQPIQVRIDTSRLHFFDLRTGKSVWD